MEFNMTIIVLARIAISETRIFFNIPFFSINVYLCYLFIFLQCTMYIAV